MIKLNKKTQIKRLYERVNELEEILCPNGKHKWVHKAETTEPVADELSMTFTYTECSRCKKKQGWCI